MPEVKEAHRAEQAHDGGRDGEDPVGMREAGNHIAEAGGERDRQAVGHLSRDVFNMVAS